MPFFFYGTLLDGSDNPVAAAIHALLEPVGPATVHGALFAVPDALGWFPALVVGDGLAHGKLYAARAGFGAADLAAMDRYEDFDPANPAASLYLRQELELTGGGSAQVYVWNRPLPAGAEPIADGDFRHWLESRGMPQFRGSHGG
ncbi:gamma-glutamylcyclotransferase [Novosphingobium sp.]|uniref:gamma-glutamylcyclotransferase family protein n=1 Tax=Novosphingobium sp. TaxID=1874826 RepID=UPI002736F4B5|nr:gamma-glutamylcyclotransferase family protein [Novosphingobium sp.]MDP3905848.1 gamma-glutamylcyclotransferase family protein [Novosphingobium sp.]